MLEENFTKYISTDKRIGESHMQVPGHDGRLGFGGACLPKDSYAFFKYFPKIVLHMSIFPGCSIDQRRF